MQASIFGMDGELHFVVLYLIQLLIHAHDTTRQQSSVYTQWIIHIMLVWSLHKMDDHFTPSQLQPYYYTLIIHNGLNMRQICHSNTNNSMYYFPPNDVCK